MSKFEKAYNEIMSEISRKKNWLEIFQDLIMKF